MKRRAALILSKLARGVTAAARAHLAGECRALLAGREISLAAGRRLFR